MGPETPSASTDSVLVGEQAGGTLPALPQADAAPELSLWVPAADPAGGDRSPPTEPVDDVGDVPGSATPRAS